MAKTEIVDSAARCLDVLLYLMRADFSAGSIPGDIGRDCKLSPSAVTRYLATLEDRGCIERIPGFERWRPSVRLAQYAAAILASLDAAVRRNQELARRISTTVQ